MRQLLRQIFVFLLLSLALSGGLEAQDEASRSSDIEVRLFLLDIESVDTVTQTFTANLTLVTRWQDPSLSHGGSDLISLPLDEVWSPKIQVLNQRKLVSTFPHMVEVYPDGEVVQRQRFWGSFSQSLELKTFPFDTQRLTISLANVEFSKDAGNLIIAPGSGISEHLTMPDWEVMGWEFIDTDFPVDGELSRIQGAVFSLDVKREPGFFIYKVILPLVLIVMMSWLVFWIDPSLAASQISVSVTAMLTMIAYRFALAGMMPRLTFLTSLDYFVLASTLVVFLSMTEVIYTAHLATTGQLERAKKMDRQARVIIPLLFVLMAMETLYFRIIV